MAATNQLANNMALVASTRLVNLKASAATFVIPKKNCGQAVNYIISQQSISLDIYGADLVMLSLSSQQRQKIILGLRYHSFNVIGYALD
jgi:hypothetical protein